jgi:hypothetical protein
MTLRKNKMDKGSRKWDNEFFKMGMLVLALTLLTLTGCASLWNLTRFDTNIENDTSIVNPDGTITWAPFLYGGSESDAREAATSQHQETRQVYIWTVQGSEYEYDKAALSRGIAEGIFRYGYRLANGARTIEVRTINTQTVNVSVVDQAKLQTLYEQYVNDKRKYIHQNLDEIDAENSVDLADTDRVYFWRGGSATGKTLKDHFSKRLQTLGQGVALINGGSRNDTVIVAWLDGSDNLVCKIPLSTYPPKNFGVW